MDVDEDKIDEAVLALLYLTLHDGFSREDVPFAPLHPLVPVEPTRSATFRRLH